VPDDAYEAFVECGETGAVAQRPPAPVFEHSPEWISTDAPGEVTWRYPGGANVMGCRVELWEETWDIWRYRLFRLDAEEPTTRWLVPPDLLHADSRFAVVVSARGEHGHSSPAVAPFVYKPRGDNPLLTYNPVRPVGLSPDAGAPVDAGSDVKLTWRLPEQHRERAAAAIIVCEDTGCLVDDPVVAYRQELPAAAGCSHRLPAAAVRPGHTYYWYVTTLNDAGLPGFAPAEGVFTVTERG